MEALERRAWGLWHKIYKFLYKANFIDSTPCLIIQAVDRFSATGKKRFPRKTRYLKIKVIHIHQAVWIYFSGSQIVLYITEYQQTLEIYQATYFWTTLSVSEIRIPKFYWEKTSFYLKTIYCKYSLLFDEKSL